MGSLSIYPIFYRDIYNKLVWKEYTSYDYKFYKTWTEEFNESKEELNIELLIFMPMYNFKLIKELVETDNLTKLKILTPLIAAYARNVLEYAIIHKSYKITKFLLKYFKDEKYSDNPTEYDIMYNTILCIENKKLYNIVSENKLDIVKMIIYMKLDLQLLSQKYIEAIKNTKHKHRLLESANVHYNKKNIEYLTKLGHSIDELSKYWIDNNKCICDTVSVAIYKKDYKQLKKILNKEKLKSSSHLAYDLTGYYASIKNDEISIEMENQLLEIASVYGTPEILVLLEECFEIKYTIPMMAFDSFNHKLPTIEMLEYWKHNKRYQLLAELYPLYCFFGNYEEAEVTFPWAIPYTAGYLSAAICGNTRRIVKFNIYMYNKHCNKRYTTKGKIFKVKSTFWNRLYNIESLLYMYNNIDNEEDKEYIIDKIGKDIFREKYDSENDYDSLTSYRRVKYFLNGLTYKF